MSSSLQNAPAQSDGGFYSWTFPDSPILVRLSLDVIGRMRDELDRDPAKRTSWNGVLLGSATRGPSVTITIWDYDTGSAAGTIRMGASASFIVGHFQFRPDISSGLSSPEVRLLQSSTCAPALLLGVDTYPNSYLATYYFLNDGRLSRELGGPTFPFDRSVRQVPQVPQPPVLSRRSRSSRAFARLTAVLLGIIGLCVTIVYIVTHRQSLLAKAVVALAQKPATQELVTVQQTGNDLLISWDRKSPAATLATSGILAIDDNGAKVERLLGPAQLSAGRLLYAPVSGNVSVRLDLRAADGSETRDVVIWLNPRFPRAIAESANEPAHTPDLSQNAPAKRPPIVSAAAGKGFQTADRRRDSPSPRSGFRPPPLPEKQRMDVGSVDLDQRLAAPALHVAAPPVSPLDLNLPALAPPPPNTAPVTPPRTTMPYSPPVPKRRVQPMSPPGTLVGPVRVDVVVKIDTQGHVTEAHLKSASGPMAVNVVQRALAVSRLWTFTPAHFGPVAVESQMLITFDFHP